MKTQNFKGIGIFLFAAALQGALCAAEDLRNLLLNPEFSFVSFIPHRTGQAVSYRSDCVPCWNAPDARSLSVWRSSRIAPEKRPAFAVPNGVELKPHQSFHQFFTFPEAQLKAGDAVSLLCTVYQEYPDAVKARIKVMKLDSEDGSWSPEKDFKLRDKRTFSRMSRGELVTAKECSVSSKITKKAVELRIDNCVIPGNFTPGKKSFSGDCLSLGLRIEFENCSDAPVWIYAPSLVRGAKAAAAVGKFRTQPDYYRHIPRTLQKLWKGETVHIVLMGSSIDRGSANPPLYAYNEDPKSPDFKKPLCDAGDFSAKMVNRPDLEPYFGSSSRFFSYGGRLKVELMKKFDLPANKILLNIMARDGSSIGESHSGLREWCELKRAPGNEDNGHKAGHTWKELYPELFTRPEGVRPDLVIYGSGANVKTDTPDEAAVFEGAIRFIQRNYPGTEFIGCIYQNNGGYTPNGNDMEAVALRYGIPFIDFGLVQNQLMNHIKPEAVGCGDGHPQAAIHYIWFKQLEKAFEVTGPVVAGFPQQQLPERMMPTAVNWEGDMIRHTPASGKRFFRPNAVILEGDAFNCWIDFDEKKVKIKRPPVFCNGAKIGVFRKNQWISGRNSAFKHGRLPFADRHVIELESPDMKFVGIDVKELFGASYTGVESIPGTAVKPYASQTGFPYGKFITELAPGRSIELKMTGDAFAVAWADTPGGGTLKVAIDGSPAAELATGNPFEMRTKEKLFLENRKGFTGFAYGVHTVKVTAEKSPVALMGFYNADRRSNRSLERAVRGFASPGQTVRFSPAFKAEPVIRCFDGLKVSSADAKQVTFGGNAGSFEAIGE